MRSCTADITSRTRTLLRTALLSVTAVACSSAPPAIRAPIAGPVVAEVRAAPGAWVGQRVRWGGEIVGTENLAASTRVEVVARRLTRDGRPIDSDRTAGRFIAEAGGFLEPTQYAPGRHVTVVGALLPAVTRNIGTHPYLYPVVKVDTLYLWDEKPDYHPYPYPYYGYDPFLRPYWYHPFPYYRPYYYPRRPRYYRPYPPRYPH